MAGHMGQRDRLRPNEPTLTALDSTLQAQYDALVAAAAIYPEHNPDTWKRKEFTAVWDMLPSGLRNAIDTKIRTEEQINEEDEIAITPALRCDYTHLVPIEIHTEFQKYAARAARVAQGSTTHQRLR